ncbi:MAG: divalent-cation tolerance protein CutA [bacterium]|nr:divalent-cation tolerance protein CutA [bacterium]MDW8164122.1 divalent cation tolerance protein CutA [Candidatus Omnitrophota bacterium]
MKFIQVIVSCPNKKVCEKIIKVILNEKIVSCCQIIGPVESHYWWEGKIEKGKEWLVFIKCKKGNFQKVYKKKK